MRDGQTVDEPQAWMQTRKRRWPVYRARGRGGNWWLTLKCQPAPGTCVMLQKISKRCITNKIFGIMEERLCHMLALLLY